MKIGKNLMVFIIFAVSVLYWPFQAGAAVLPTTDIKANGSDGPVSIALSENLSVTIALDPGDYPGVQADWWCVADTPSGWYYYKSATETWLPGFKVSYQAPLGEVSPPLEVLNMSDLPAGTYTIYFGVDGNRNGNFDEPSYYDSVEVSITPGSVTTYTITATAGANGSISPSGAVTVNEGTDQAFEITPDPGYQVADVLVDGSSVGAVTSYTFNNVYNDYTIDASFESVATYTITAAAGANGSISPSGEVTVNEGADQAFEITPDPGYQVADVLVDGSSVGAVTSYTFTNVYNDYTIDAFFEAVVVPADIIIDNGEPGSSYTGTWTDSSGTNSYGTTSVFARPEATFTWDFDAPLPGYYEVFLWWTTTTTRGSFIPVEIVTAEGIISTTIDQTVNGGQWNSLGTYRFDGTGGSVKITASDELLPDGTTVSTCADAARFRYVSSSIAENIYVVNAYGTTSYVWDTIVTMLEGLGATEDSGVWHYYNPDKDATYFIREVKTLQGYEQALKEEGSHVIYNGHSNYGLGATFAMTAYQRNQIRFFDDDLFLIYGTDMVDPDISGMKFGQPYPNWEPVYKNGESAIMPYDFGDPNGPPPYNYYLTYTLPGDPVHYKIELADGSPIERFPDSGVQAWYASDGSKPDPIANPEYFIIAPGDDFNKCEFTGDWAYDAPGDWHHAVYYMGYNYQYHSPGTGANKATFTLVVKSPGLYAVVASWYPDPSNASNATFTIQHADMGGGEYSTVVVDQRESEVMNMLGVYYYNEGTYTIEISDDANGRVVADVVILQSIDDPQSVFRAEFSADSTEGSAPHTVQFIDGSTVYISGNFAPEVTWYWDFGDGETSESQSPTHTYTAPGTYDVSFTITMTDEFGDITHTDTEVKEGFIVVDSAANLHAEFTAQGLMGQQKTVIAFHDQSSGNITSWHWDFGDGAESFEQNPTHEYTTIGSFTVTLTVFGPSGDDSESEVDFVYNTIGMVVVDNTFHTKPHYYRNYSGAVLGSVIMDASPVTMQSEEFKFSRMFINACYTHQYFLEKFNRGVVFYTLGGREEDKSPTDVYLREYLLGKSDDEILRKMNEQHHIHGYYDFRYLPPSMQ